MDDDYGCPHDLLEPWEMINGYHGQTTCRVSRRVKRRKVSCDDDIPNNNFIIWVWVNTYRYIFSGMNIHLPAILGFTRYQGFDPSPYKNYGRW